MGTADRFRIRTKELHVMTLLERSSCRCETSLGTARYVSSLVTDS